MAGSKARRRWAACAISCVGLALAGCSAASTSGSSPSGAASTQLPAATPSATSSTGFPREAASPGAAADTGFTVWITSSGFRPAILIAPCCDAVTWKNMTSAPVAVVFDAVAGGSRGTIPPGGIYVFVPHNVESIAYHSGSDPKVTGQVEVNQLAE